MYFAFVLLGLGALTTAAPHSQNLYKRDGDCSMQTAGPGPVASPDTVSAFYSLSALQSASSAAPIPSGFSFVFANLQASISAPGYMGVITLSSYDTIGCAAKCNQAAGCVAFNVYAERDPSLNPNATACPNPPSTTNYLCTLWSSILSPSQATNNGQYRDTFQVVIAASNAYNRLPSCSSAPAIVNGNFAAPTLSPWSVYNPTILGWTSGSATSLGFSASLGPNPNHPTPSSSLYLSQPLTTCPGRNYTLAFSASFHAPTPGLCGVQATVGNGGVGLMSADGSPGPVALRTVFTAQTASDQLSFDFYCQAGYNTVLVADVTVVLV